MKCIVLIIGLYLGAIQAGEVTRVITLPVHAFQQTLAPEHAYLWQREWLAPEAGVIWNRAELRTALFPFCLRSFFFCAVEETELNNVRGNLPLKNLSKEVREQAADVAHNAVLKYFAKHPAATFETMVQTTEWQATLLGQEPVTENDVWHMVDTLIAKITRPLSIEKISWA